MNFIKKNFKMILSNLIVAILVTILASGITVYASGLMAGSINYTNTKTVASALDDLYNLKTATVEDLIDNKLQNYSSSANSNFAIIDINTPNSATATWTKLCDYPAGFNHNNCILLSGYIQNSAGKIIVPYTFNQENMAVFLLDTDGIDIYINDSTFFNCSGKLILKKIS